MYLPDGVPTTFRASHVPATDDLPKHVEAALLTKEERTVNTEVHREYMSLVGALLYCSTQTRPD
eukprot:494844-Pleurochrysis_carterae.AAC.1